MTRPSCLVIDDEPDILELMKETLTRMDIECVTAENVSQAIYHLNKRSFSFCLTDLRLPDRDGLELVDIVQQEYPNMPIAVITAHGNMESAMRAYRAGAFDFISKPFLDIEQFRNLVNSAVRLEGLQNVVKTGLNLSKLREDTLSRLIGESSAMQTLRVKVEKLARSEAPIYIRGESGVGKEVVAQMIHKLGVRAGKPFIPVNCGAIPADLVESEFFGYKKGTFTGAQTNKLGLFQEAHGGTLFLDEVGDLPLAMQVKLLRAVQEKKIRPIGASKEVSIDIRILSATHHNLAELVKQKKFREDLFYRINVIELYVPPLREHPEDIDLLVENILNQLSAHSKQSTRPSLTAEAKKALQEYRFPGNVRELENILERAVALCENNAIDVADLQLPEQSKVILPSETDVSKEEMLEALRQAKGNKTKAAQLLGLGFGAFRHRLKKLDITYEN